MMVESIPPLIPKGLKLNDVLVYTSIITPMTKILAQLGLKLGSKNEAHKNMVKHVTNTIVILIDINWMWWLFQWSKNVLLQVENPTKSLPADSGFVELSSGSVELTSGSAELAPGFECILRIKWNLEELGQNTFSLLNKKGKSKR